jgi:hypothetical protein
MENTVFFAVLLGISKFTRSLHAWIPGPRGKIQYIYENGRQKSGDTFWHSAAICLPTSELSGSITTH